MWALCQTPPHVLACTHHSPHTIMMMMTITLQRSLLWHNGHACMCFYQLCRPPHWLAQGRSRLLLLLGGFATRRVRCRAGTDVRAPCAPSSCELSAWSLAVLVQRVANTPIDCIPSSLTCKWMRVLVVHIVRWILRGSLIIEVWCTPFDEQARVLHRQSVTAVRLYAVEL